MTFTAKIKITGPTGSSLNYAGPVTVEQKDCIVSALHGETDIATLEQEARQMRARMERLECENAQLMNLFEASQEALRQETCISFRNQVTELEKQRDELLAALEGAANYIDRLSGDSSGYRIAIASVRGAGCGMKGGATC